MKKILLLLVVLIVSCGVDNTAPETQVIHVDGSPGKNGHSVVHYVMPAGSACTNDGTIVFLATDMNDNLLFDSEDTNIQSMIICNGINSPPTQFTPVEIIDPCGDSPSINDEIFLKLYNGTLLASFSDNINGLNTRFSVIVSGSYRTTDGTNCYFSVDSSGNIYNEHY